MLPSAIIKWADKYELDHTIVWEMVEIVTNTGASLDEIEDESHLFDLAIQWAIAMTESVYDDPIRPATQSFLLYYVPFIYRLAPYMTYQQRTALMNAAGTDTPILTDAMDIILDTDARPNR